MLDNDLVFFFSCYSKAGSIFEHFLISNHWILVPWAQTQIATRRVKRWRMGKPSRFWVCVCGRGGGAGFPYRFDKLNPRVSKFREPPANVYNIFNTVIGRSHLCFRSVLYFLNNPFHSYTPFQNIAEF